MASIYNRLSSRVTWTGRSWSRHRSIWELRSVTVPRKYRWCFCYRRALIPWPASLCSPNNAACTRSKLINESVSYFRVHVVRCWLVVGVGPVRGLACFRLSATCAPCTDMCMRSVRMRRGRELRERDEKEGEFSD